MFIFIFQIIRNSIYLFIHFYFFKHGSPSVLNDCFSGGPYVKTEGILSCKIYVSEYIIICVDKAMIRLCTDVLFHGFCLNICLIY